jgi:hypothetical protein
MTAMVKAKLTSACSPLSYTFDFSSVLTQIRGGARSAPLPVREGERGEGALAVLPSHLGFRPAGRTPAYRPAAPRSRRALLSSSVNAALSSGRP